MEQRRLGRIGHMSSVLIYGGAALSDVPQELADRSIQLAMEAGINHFDTAAAYGDSELRLGPWMPRVRHRIFLSTKTGDRTAVGAYESIRRSLDRLQVDRVDLIQLHAVCDLEDLDRATETGGGLEGALRAADEGLIGAIGIIGHGMAAPATHLEALRRFSFDTVLTPFNYRLSLEPGYMRDFEALVEEIQTQDVGLMLIKAKVTGICTAGDVRLLPMMIQAEPRAGAISVEAAAATLSGVPELEPPFVRVDGRAVPDWLEPLLPGG